MVKQPLVAIIILNWNGYDVTMECLSSLDNIEYNNLKIILVDNGSSDGSIEKFKVNLDLNRIDLMELETNTGFTGGNNCGIKYAIQNYDPEYCLLLNNDTVVEPNFINELVKPIEKDSNCFAVVPKIFFYDTPKLLWFAGGEISSITCIARHNGLNKVDSKEYSAEVTTSFMNGCCALISREAINTLGILDNEFFANCEDTDYSLRILKSGHTIIYCPSAVIYHKVSYSFRSNKGKWLAFYLASRNTILLQKKHIGKWMQPISFSVFLIRWVFYLILKLSFLNDFKSIKGILIGVNDGLFNKLRFVKK